MIRYLIDHKGKIWSHPARGLGEALGYANPDFDIWAYAVRNLGAVELAIESGLITISMRSATASAEAIRATESFLPTLGSSSVRVRYEIGTWIEETYEDPLHAAGWIASALADAARESQRVAFSTKSRKLDVLAQMRLNRIETNEERLGLIFKKWRISQGTFNVETTDFLVRFGLLDRAVIVNESQNSRELVFSHAGMSLNLYNRHDKSWMFNVVGQKLEDQPDRDYGRWVSKIFRGVLNENQPRFDFVDVVVQPPKSQPYRSQYDRLLLPWHTPHGERLVSSLSFNPGAAATAA